jgi:HD superfamily phosphohydrolase
MPARVVALLRGTHRLAYLSRCVSGMLDVDRCDYLLRDSHMTGVRYGIYDLDWVLRALTFGCVRDSAGAEHWVLAIEGRKGLPPIEGYFLARSFMYQQVYHHKATRAAEALIRGIFLRVAALIRGGRVPEQTPRALVAAMNGEPVGLSDYLRLDDVALLSAFRVWESDADPALAMLTRQLSARELPKTLPLPGDARVWQVAAARAREVAERHGHPPDLTVRLDVATEMTYGEPDDESPEGLWVSIRHRPMTRLGRISFVLGELRNKSVERPRLIFPAAIRDELLASLQDVIGGDAGSGR